MDKFEIGDVLYIHTSRDKHMFAACIITTATHDIYGIMYDYTFIYHDHIFYIGKHYTGRLTFKTNDTYYEK